MVERPLAISARHSTVKIHIPMAIWHQHRLSRFLQLIISTPQSTLPLSMDHPQVNHYWGRLAERVVFCLVRARAGLLLYLYFRSGALLIHCSARYAYLAGVTHSLFTGFIHLMTR